MNLVYSVHKPVLRVTILFCMAQISKPIYCLYGEIASSLYRYSIWTLKSVQCSVSKLVLPVTILFCMAQISKPIYCLYSELAA